MIIKKKEQSPTFSSVATSYVQEGWVLKNHEVTQFTPGNGVHQDGGIALCRDASGCLWGIFGFTAHSLPIWKGTCLDDMQFQYNAAIQFQYGMPGNGFNGVKYPDGPRSRGHMWPMGLWIDPCDGKFYCYFHTESGWGSGGQGYTITGQSDGEPDFRHIGLMTSVDQGRNWEFIDWVLTANPVCYSTLYKPDPDLTGGQTGPEYCLGAGDFSLFINDRDGYLYLFYSMVFCKVDGAVIADRVFGARSKISDKGMPGTWWKCYEGGFTEPGNGGRETALLEDGAEPSVVYNTYLEQYMMTTYNRSLWTSGKCTVRLSASSDLIHWSTAKPLDPDLPDASEPYWTLCSAETGGNPKFVGQTFRLMHNQFSNDVKKLTVVLERKNCAGSGNTL